MRLPTAPDQYSQSNEAQARQTLLLTDKENMKRRENIRLDSGIALVIKDEVTGDLYRLKVASGVLSIVSFP